MITYMPYAPPPLPGMPREACMIPDAAGQWVRLDDAEDLAREALRLYTAKLADRLDRSRLFGTAAWLRGAL